MKMRSLCPRCKGSVRLMSKSIGTLTGKTGFEGYCSRCFEVVNIDVDLKTNMQSGCESERYGIEDRIVGLLGVGSTV